MVCFHKIPESNCATFNIYITMVMHEGEPWCKVRVLHYDPEVMGLK